MRAASLSAAPSAARPRRRERAQQQRRHRVYAAPAAAANGAANTTTSAKPFSCRPATPTEFWPLAQLHCDVFAPRHPQGSWPHALGAIDRMLALNLNVALERRQAGRYACVCVYSGEGRTFCC
jgi:hypothetical protein